MSQRLYPNPERDVEEILRDTDDFFLGRGPVHATLHALTRRLEREGIRYAVAGGMALYLLGYERKTVDLDILLTRSGLERFREILVGQGYRPLFPGARKSFRDADTGVRIDLLTTGEFPGDGKPKPVSFPDPDTASIERRGYRVLSPEKLIELKIASGLSVEHRKHIDLADVQRFIEEVRLPLGLAEKLDPSVREEYRRLWELAQRAGEGPHEREPRPRDS